MNLRYKIINEELKVYSCQIGNLPIEQAKELFKRYDEDFTLADITVFYDENERVIVINSDSQYYDICKDLVITYLRVDEEKRKKVKEEAGDIELVAGITKVLDNALLDMEFKRNMSILMQQKQIKEDFTSTRCVLLELQKRREQYGTLYVLYLAFLYGFMNGKKTERAKRRKAIERGV